MSFVDALSYLNNHHDLVTAGTAILAVFISLLSIILAVCNMRMQRTHNRKSILPIAYLSLGDYEQHVFVRLDSQGAGPMIIDELSILNAETRERLGSFLIELMPKGIAWETFFRDIRGRALRPDQEISLISLKGSPDDPCFIAGRDEVRRALSKLIVRIDFHSVYEQRFTYERALDWFARKK